MVNSCVWKTRLMSKTLLNFVLEEVSSTMHVGKCREFILGPVWYSSQQLHELFFLPNTYFQNSFMGEAVFFLLSQRHKLDEAGKK